jgi:hypothetical protein
VNAARFEDGIGALSAAGHPRSVAVCLGAAGKPAELIAGGNYSHMELPGTLCNPYGADRPNYPFVTIPVRFQSNRLVWSEP